MITHKEIAERVLCDMYMQGVSVRKPAEIFDTRPAYFCHLKHEDRYLKIPAKLWAKLRAYCNSKKRFIDFKL